ncbi:hypothetical protein DENSPDRAFT_857172 [Dentipellis sp. KUC8613]|nr:hypothetical protein DENSPDRAFT_857172 [Dentipellis sp. KUC8613]
MIALSRLLTAVAVLGSVVPFAAATSVSANGCASGEFFYENKSCCVKQGAPKNPPQPPVGKSCPSSNSENWYWSSDKTCCLPTNPPPPGNPAPSCPKNHIWDHGNSYCSPPESRNPPNPPSGPSSPSKPSPSTSAPHTSSTPSTPSGPSSPGKGTGTGTCDSSEFWYEAKKCCLPHGGPTSTPPAPPPGKSCPPSGWYWGKDQGCCVPHNPPENNPPPQCEKSWNWIPSIFQCQPSGPSSPPSAPPSKPSGHHYKKRATHKSRTASLCPSDLTACPISGLSSAWECVDVQQELESCGGCVIGGEGQDCTAIKGAWNVGCEQGSCKVYTCMNGYKLSSDNKTCVAL